jgi:hypothetical protein
MNNVFTKNQAAVASAGGDRLARFVRHGVVACMLACSAAGAMAAGQDRGPRQDMQRDRYDSRAQDQRYDARAYEMQMQAREEERRRMIEDRDRQQQRDEGRRRLTPDERSDLRRQINEAGRDLYPNARRR